MAAGSDSQARRGIGRTPPHGDPLDGEGPSVARLRARGREVRQEGRAFADATQGFVAEASELAREQLEERPYWVLGAAFAVGWILGGGVPPRAAKMAGDVAARAATSVLASRLAEAVASPSASGPAGEGDPD